MRLHDKAGHEYRAHFQHEKHITADQGVAPFSTTCTLHPNACAKKERPCGTESLIGIAYCSVLDQFDYRTGRKLSFARAMAPLPKTLRTELWESYFQQSPNSKVRRRK